MNEEYSHGGNIYDFSEKVIDFSANLNPLGMPGGAFWAAMRSIGMCEHYPDPQCRELTAAIAGTGNVRPEHVICGNGAADLIFRFVYALRPGTALIMAPSFSEYKRALLAGGCEVREHFLREGDDFALTGGVLDALDGSLDALFLCNPDNPVGRLIGGQLLDEIAEKCSRNGTMLFMDECFIDFVQGAEGLTVKDKIAGNDNIFVLKAFTKTYAMPGLRLGYGLCSNAELLNAMNGCGQPWAVSAVAQAAGVAALAEEGYIERSVEYVERERERLIAAINGMGLKTYGSRANFVFFKGPAGLYGELLARKILIRKCDNYSGLTSEHFRAAVRTESENSVLISVMENILG